AVAREHADTLVAFTSEHGLAFWRIYGAVQQGWALAMQGHGDEGCALIRENLDRLRATGAEMPRTYFLALLADASLKAGRIHAGIEAVTEALAAARARAERFWEPELHRLRGELLRRAGRLRGAVGHRRSLDEAESSFASALDVARRLRARSFELRAG